MAILNPFRIGQGVLGQQLGPYPYGVLNAGQVPYWDGNEFKIPGFTPQPWIYNPPAQPSAPSAPSADPQSNPNAGILAAMMQGGDGGAGNGFGDREPSASPAQDVSQEQGVPAGYGLGMVSPVSMQEQGVPAGYGVGVASPVGVSAPTAPAEGLAAGVPGSDANAPSGAQAGKAGMSSQQAANQAATQAASANTAAAIASVDKALQEAPASFMDAVKSAMQATASNIGLGAAGLGMKSDIATNPEENASVAAGVSGENAGMGSGGGLGGADGVGGPGAGGMGSPGGMGGGGSGAPGGSSDQGPGSWRKGGHVGDDGDGKLEPVRGILHEREFVLTPEVTAMLNKKSPGLLNRLAKMQKMMAA